MTERTTGHSGMTPGRDRSAGAPVAPGDLPGGQPGPGRSAAGPRRGHPRRRGRVPWPGDGQTACRHLQSRAPRPPDHPSRGPRRRQPSGDPLDGRRHPPGELSRVSAHRAAPPFRGHRPVPHPGRQDHRNVDRGRQPRTAAAGRRDPSAAVGRRPSAGAATTKVGAPGRTSWPLAATWLPGRVPGH